MLNENIELLKFIYQNSKMGLEAVFQLLKIIEEGEVKKHLLIEQEEYFLINQKAEYLLNYFGFEEEDLAWYEKFRSYWTIQFETLNDKSDSHIAQMLIIGSVMGIIDAKINLKKYKYADDNVLELMEELRKMEENNVTILYKLL